MISGITAVACCVVALAPPAQGPGPSAADQRLAPLLAAIHARRDLAFRELDRLPELAKEATQGVMTKLAAFWSGDEARKEFEAHYAAVAKKLDGVTLRDAHGNIEVYWAMQQAVFSETALKLICTEFIDDVAAATRHDQEALLGALGRRFGQVADEEFRKAQDSIRAKVDAVIATHFPAWEGRKIPIAVRVQPGVKPAKPGPTLPPYLGLAGVLVLVFRKALARIVQMMVEKMVGKVLAKLIPIIGWLLILLELWDVASAKAKLEESLRTAYLAEYKAAFAPEPIWNEMQDDTRKAIYDDLVAWTQRCKEEGKRVLDAAEILEAPGVREWLQKKERSGNLDVVLEQLVQVREVFGHLVLSHKIDLLIEILAFAPDKAELRGLVAQLGSRPIEEYERGGPDFLNAAHHIGLLPFLEILRDKELDWKRVYAAVKDLPRNVPAEEIAGVVNALRVGVDPQTLSSADRQQFGRIGRETLTLLAAACPDRAKLRTLVIDRKARDPAETLCREAPDLAAGWIADRELADVRQLQDERRRKALVGLFQLRKTQGNSSVKTFVAQATDGEIGAFQRFGKDGIEIRDAYLRGGSGEYQEAQAERALNMFERGVAKEAILRPELLGLADWVTMIPGVGPPVFNLLYPIFPGSRVGVIILAIFLPLVTLLACALVTWRLLCAFRRPRGPAPPEPAPTTPLKLTREEPVRVQVTLSPERPPERPLLDVTDVKPVEPKPDE